MSPRLPTRLATALVPALALALALPLAGCRTAPRDESALELRTYDVPKGTIRPLLSTFKDAFWMADNKNIGRATTTPDGRLAVLATENVQAGVAKLIAGVQSAAPKPDQSIELHYFIVLGKPAAAAPPPANAAEIQPALDEIARSQGPQAFTIAKRIALTSLNDDEGRLDGDELEIRQKGIETTDGVYSYITIRYGKVDKIETRVRLVQDRIVVLGATGQHAGDADGSTLYYLVRVAPRADGPRP